MMAASPSDDELWNKVLAGDPGALTLLYERMLRPSSTTAISGSCPDPTPKTSPPRCSRPPCARGPVTVFPDAGLRPWLFGVANNLLRRYHSARSASDRLARRLAGRYADVPDIAEECAEQSEDRHYVALLNGILRKLARTIRT